MTNAVPPPIPDSSMSGSRTLGYQLLRYPREGIFYRKLEPQIEELRKGDSKLEEKIEREEEKFFQFLSHAVDIDQMGNMASIIDTVKENLGTELPLQVFLTEFDTAHAMCIPRLSVKKDAEVEELVVVVSQHFINNLNDAERASILGHELGHALLGHSTIPKQAILDNEVDVSKQPEIRSNILRWSVCCEVSCDIFGFVATGGDAASSQSALLKFTTGLDSQTFASLGAAELVNQVLKQYDSLADHVVKSVISTHPLTPLRLKLMSELPSMDLFQHFGTQVSSASLAKLTEDLQARIDPLVESIYPELFEEKEKDHGYILFHLGVATALADGDMDRDEIMAINKIIKPSFDTESYFNSLEETLRVRELSSVIEELIERAVTEAKEKDYAKADATWLARNLLVVAAADGKVDSNELMVVYHFGKHFGLTKNEIVYLANQVQIPEKF